MADRGRGRRTDYTWSNFGDRENAHDISTVAGVFGTTGFTSGAAQTITRIRGKVGAVLDPGAVNESVMILFGLMVLATDSFVGGAAPEIFTNSQDEASWIWQGALWLDSGDEAAIVTDNLSGSIEVDSKAMRRIKINDTLAFVFQTPTELANDQTGLINLTYYFHVLTGD